MSPTHSMSLKYSGFAVLAVLLSTSATQAAVAITGNISSATAPVINSTYGTLEFALNVAGIPLTRDGITFTTAGATDVGSVRTFLSGPINVLATTAGGGSWATIDFSAADPLFYTVAYSTNSQGYSIELTGLDVAKSYQLQFLFGDPRVTYPHTRDVTVSDSPSLGPNTSVATLSYGGTSLGDEFAMLTATVSGSTSFTFTSPSTGPGVGGPIIAGLVVHSVPEPSTALLGGLALLGLLCRRR
jgi:PEP-CTERM motif